MIRRLTLTLALVLATSAIAVGDDGPRAATAGAYRLDLTDNYTFDAQAMLPWEARNKDFSSAWLMLIAYRGTDSSISPFLEIGIIRDVRRAFALQSFVSVQRASAPVSYREGAFVTDAWHALSIRRKGTKISLLVDGDSLFETNVAAYFRSDDHLYVQIGAQLRGVGDSVDARWRGFSEMRSGVRVDPMPGCFWSGQGLSARPDGVSGLEISGVYDPLVKPVVQGDCAGAAKL